MDRRWGVFPGHFFYRRQYGQTGALRAARRSRDYAAGRRFGNLDSSAFRARRHAARNGRRGPGAGGTLGRLCSPARADRRTRWCFMVGRPCAVFGSGRSRFSGCDWLDVRSHRQSCFSPKDRQDVAQFRSGSLALVLGISLVLPGTASGAAANRELEGIRKKIENEKKGLSQLQVKEGSVLDSLGKIQSELDMRNQELKRASAKLIAVSDELALKESEAQSLDQSFASRSAILNRRAVALYKWHKSGSPLAVFNGD